VLLSLKEEKTVDAIVRPQLTKLRPTQVTQVTQYLNIGTVAFLQQEKFMENFGDGGVGPPPSNPFPVLPPPGKRGFILPRGV
jgi:hypothetical protein